MQSPFRTTAVSPFRTTAVSPFRTTAVSPFRKVSAWEAEMLHRKKLNDEELDITKPYYAKLHIEKQELDVSDTPQLREELRRTLGKLLLSTQNANTVIAHLDQTDDLLNFYKLHKPFTRSIEGVPRLDSSYLINLWTKFRDDALKQAETRPHTTVEWRSHTALAGEWRSHTALAGEWRSHTALAGDVEDTDIETHERPQKPTPVDVDEDDIKALTRMRADIARSVVPLVKTGDRQYSSMSQAKSNAKKISNRLKKAKETRIFTPMDQTSLSL